MATGTALAPVRTPSLPRAVALALTGEANWSSAWALSIVLRDRPGTDLRPLANAANASRAPADPAWLNNRLSLVWLSSGHRKDDDVATAWLHETSRLLRDLPQDIIDRALDEVVLANDRGFVPAVGAVRKVADPIAAERTRKAARLEAMARLQESGAKILPAAHLSDQPEEAATPCTPEEAAAIVEELGLKAEARERVRVALGPPRSPTREDYIAMGVDPAILDKPKEETE